MQSSKMSLNLNFSHQPSHMFYIVFFNPYLYNKFNLLFSFFLATSRILERLNRYENPKPAPDVIELRAPVPDVPNELLVNNHAMVAFLQDDVINLVSYAK